MAQIFFSLISKRVAADVNPLHSKNEPAHAGCYGISAVSQPMRWALAMTDNVIVVAGAPGKTVASTACTRVQPCGRPRQSLSNGCGFSRIGNEPPQWKPRPGSASCSIGGKTM